MAEEATAVSKFDVEIDAPKNVLKIACAGLRLLGEKKIQFDHRLCNQLIGYREVPGDRPLRPNHVNYLISTMMRGTFHPEWVKLIVCQFDGETWRMNGQHTAMARLEMPERWKDAGQVGVMTYEASTHDAMRELYSSIDRGAPRTKGNVLSSYLTDTEQFQDASETLIKLMGEGLAMWLWESGHERNKHDSDEVAWLMQHTHKTLVSTILAFALQEPRMTSGFMRRSSVVAAMCESFGKVYQDSADFWNAVRTGVGFTAADDPRLRLRNYLAESRVGSHDTRVRAKNVDRESMYRICVLAFNKFRKHESCKVLMPTKDRQRAK